MKPVIVYNMFGLAAKVAAQTVKDAQELGGEYLGTAHSSAELADIAIKTSIWNRPFAFFIDGKQVSERDAMSNFGAEWHLDNKYVDIKTGE